MTTTQDPTTRQQHDVAEARRLVEHIKHPVWQLLATLRVPDDAGEPVPCISHAPHLTIEALSEVMLQLMAALVARDPVNELPRVRHHLEAQRLQLEILAAPPPDGQSH